MVVIVPFSPFMFLAHKGKKVTFTQELATKAQRASGYIVLLFLQPQR
jgi:hypothetical protein